MALTAGDLIHLASSIAALNDAMTELLSERDHNGHGYGPVFVPAEIYVVPVGELLHGEPSEGLKLVWGGDPELGFMLATEVSE